VEIDGIVLGWFTACGGLSIEREVLPYKEGGLNAYVHQLPGRVKSADITLKRGIAERELWQWFRKGLYDLKVERRNVSIISYAGDRTEAERWDLTDAFPLKWSGPELKTDGKQVAVETLTIGQGSAALSAQVQRAEELGQGGGQTTTVVDSGQAGALDQDVNVPLLADKVYDLLKKELRWERERLGRNRSW
jgi:phage tail-like protein